MKLTGKCLESFISFMCKNYPEIKWHEYETMPKCILNALIIEFFDSVGISIDIRVDIRVDANNNTSHCDDFCENCVDCYDTWNTEYLYFICVFTEIINNQNDYSTICSDDNFDTRTEAQNEAIEKANKLYNEKL